MTLLTTYYCILTYEFPVTAESPGTPTFRKYSRGSASSSGVIFLSRKSTGLSSSPARFGFLPVNLLSPSWLFSIKNRLDVYFLRSVQQAHRPAEQLNLFSAFRQIYYSNKVFKSQGNPSGVAKSFHIVDVLRLPFLNF